MKINRKTLSACACALSVSLGCAIPSSFIVEEAGVALDVSGSYQGIKLLSIKGAEAYPSNTDLLMTTVSAYGNADSGVPAALALRAAFARNSQVLPVRALYGKEETAAGAEKRATQMMTDSQDHAVAVALEKTGHQVSMKISVAGVDEESHAVGLLEEGDVVTSITVGSQTTELRAYGQLAQVLAGTEAGTEVTLRGSRDGSPMEATFTTLPNVADESGWKREGSRLGVYLSTSDMSADITVDYGIEGIGGPSAGLMFSLGIYDMLTEGSLGGDNTIAGTGTIELSGQVGAIGGIRHKMEGASQEGATYFLAPATNCEETIGYEPEGMKVFAVHTFDDALAVVEAIASGNTSGLPTCASLGS